ncbi:MAG: O-antigen ligase family protein [Saprospiraceae bacterium]|nr:O-antigen ligase family protein [Saprospiraceae bacterium]
MRQKNSPKTKSAVVTEEKDPLAPYRLLLWLVFGVNALVLWWQCLDRYLAPRFLFLSLSLLLGLVLLWRDLRERADWRLHTFDLLMLGWYALNVVSITWAFSWSEAVFYSQKVLLLFSVYWLVRQALLRDESMVRQVLHRATLLLTWVVCGILLVQLAMAFGKHGLNNDALYDYASAVYGNKSLATEFLFFLLVFNVLFRKEFSRKLLFYASTGLLAVLILLLQTRTVYVAVAAGALLYFPARAWLAPEFRPVFFRKILPAGVLLLLLLLALIALKGRGSSLAERLNPATYLESVSANERRFVWYKTDMLNQDHYWLGVGNGSWKFWFPSKNIQGGYRLQEQNVVFTRAHNDYLEIRSEMGIVGAGLFISIFVVAFIAALFTLRNEKAETTRHDVLVLSIGLLGYCIIQYLDFPRERIEMQVVLAVLLAYLTFHATKLWAKMPGISIRNSATTFTGLVALGLLFNVVIGWYRVTGEIHAMRAMEAQSRRDHRTTIKESQAARNLFNEYNDVAIPLQWHEGIAWYYLDQMDPCLAAFEEAYRLNPWSFQVMHNYASALLKRGDTQQAISILEQAVAINPKYDEGKFNISYAYLQVENYPKALEWLQRIDTIPNPQTEDARRKNRETLGKQEVLLKEIQGRMR